MHDRYNLYTLVGYERYNLYSLADGLVEGLYEEAITANSEGLSKDEAHKEEQDKR
ncbi:MAG: hypothetical protein Q4D21_08740 [Phascolarctobacterium sp.]|nr:hypothetical protein [Phascolarctobacterium sp.]